MNLSSKLILLGALLSLTACNGANDALKPYVQQSVELKTSGAVSNPDTTSSANLTLVGQVAFTNVQYYMTTETQCDTFQCGWDTRSACDYVNVCGEASILERGHGDHDGDDGDHDGGWGGGWHHGGPDCWPRPINCRTWEEPRYCTGNCREVPVERSRNIEVDSPVYASVSGTMTADDAKKLDLAFGVKTNSNYQEAVANPTTLPAKLADLFQNLTRNDKTVLVLKSKTLRLVPGQDFMDLPANFKQGDAIYLNVEVEQSSNPDGYSAVGSETDLPDLVYTSGPQN